MSFPLVDYNNSLETLVINDGVIKGLIGQKLEGCKSKNSLGKEEDAGDNLF